MKSFLEITSELEKGSLSPKALTRSMRKECVRYYKAKGYSALEIASILKTSTRSVFRHLAAARKENAFSVGPSFQREIVGEVLNDLRSQHARLVRLSYSDELDDYEKVRAICATCQVEKDMVAILERLGYLNKEAIERKAETNLSDELFAPDDPLLSKVDRLLPEQRAEVINLLKTDQQCDMRKVATMVQFYITDNQNKGLYESDGKLKTSSGLSNVIPWQSESTQTIDIHPVTTSG